MSATSPEQGRDDGYAPLIPGVYMRRLLSQKTQQRYVELKVEDKEILESLRSVLDVLTSDDYLEDFAKPVAEKAKRQLNDPKKVQGNAHHIILELDESVTFFNILIEVDKADQELDKEENRKQRAAEASAKRQTGTDDDTA